MTDDRLTAEEKAVIEAAMAYGRTLCGGPADGHTKLIWELKQAAYALDISRQPQVCEPPESHRHEIGPHWLQSGGAVRIVAYWLAPARVWRDPINGEKVSRTEAVSRGWSYHSPCLPPGSEPEKVEISDEAAWELAGAHANYRDEHGLQSFNCYRLGDFARAVLARLTLPAMTDEELRAAWRELERSTVADHHRRHQQAFPCAIDRAVTFARIVRGEKAE